MLEKYLEKQEIATNLLLNEKKNNKIVQAYLFVSTDKSFLMQYSLDFAKEIITDENDSCNSINCSFFILPLDDSIIFSSG